LTAEKIKNLTIHQAAEYVGVNPRTIRRWISQGQLPASRVGPRLVRIKADDLEGIVRRMPTAELRPAPAARQPDQITQVAPALCQHKEPTPQAMRRLGIRRPKQSP
jgi:excisionase family DNA binding protein